MNSFYYKSIKIKTKINAELSQKIVDFLIRERQFIYISDRYRWRDVIFSDDIYRLKRTITMRSGREKTLSKKIVLGYGDSTYQADIVENTIKIIRVMPSNRHYPSPKIISIFTPAVASTNGIMIKI